MGNNGAPPSVVNVTFILGNGFDLHLGMKTSYQDVYESYIKTESSSEIIRKFKEDLANRNKLDKWSDFEMGMAKYAETLSSEEEFVECVRDFKKHMVSHLNAEDERMSNIISDSAYSKGIVFELEKTLTSFYAGFSPNVVNKIRQKLNTPFVQYNTITFNYTQIIEKLYAVYALNNKRILDVPIHIHGTLAGDVVSGVDNVEQFKNLKFTISRRGKRAFVKTYFNEEYDSIRVNKAKQIISESTIICTYGFSMGESDSTWVRCLIDWLRSDNHHHLIVFQYDNKKYYKYNSDEILDVEDAKKEQFMKKLGVEEELFDQIHIPVGFDIFNVELVKIIGAKTATPPK